MLRFHYEHDHGVGAPPAAGQTIEADLAEDAQAAAGSSH